MSKNYTITSQDGARCLDDQGFKFLYTTTCKNDPISCLNQLHQQYDMPRPIYSDPLKSGSEHNPQWAITCMYGNKSVHATGETIKMAKKNCCICLVQYIYTALIGTKESSTDLEFSQETKSNESSNASPLIFLSDNDDDYYSNGPSKRTEFKYPDFHDREFLNHCLQHQTLYFVDVDCTADMVVEYISSWSEENDALVFLYCAKSFNAKALQQYASCDNIYLHRTQFNLKDSADTDIIWDIALLTNSMQEKSAYKIILVSKDQLVTNLEYRLLKVGFDVDTLN